jgi:hypothetical protein
MVPYIKLARPQSKQYSETCSIANFETREQTCRLRQLSGSGGEYFFPASGINQGLSTAFSGFQSFDPPESAAS